MITSPFGLETLRTCLAGIAPVELQGMGLLRAQPHLLAGNAVIPPSHLVEAVTEIVAYTGRCTAAARQLAQITPIPIRAIGIVEYVL
ncbi:MAG: hypothetical protein JNJ61_30530 [Anaerolineae bacterium]|nr:hypothetical protein [Anaerolineae bacterium]